MDWSMKGERDWMMGDGEFACGDESLLVEDVCSLDEWFFS